MTRGKYGAKAVKRQETQALESEIARLQHALVRTEKDRDDLTETLRRKESAYAIERRSLLADVEGGTSPRTRQLEDRVADLAARLKESEAEHLATRDAYGKIVEWFRDHMIDVHGILHADWLEKFYGIVTEGSAITTDIGMAGARKRAPEPHLERDQIEKVRAIQRARGLRK